MYNESKFHLFPALESAVAHGHSTGPKRILIVTQDIVGPINNGGIGTAYYYAATETTLPGASPSFPARNRTFPCRPAYSGWQRIFPTGPTSG
jgi:hypothetical protein